MVTGVAQRVGHSALSVVAAVGRSGMLATGAVRAVRKVDIWGPLFVPQLAAVGVASVPIALFIAAFTGIVLAIQANYTFIENNGISNSNLSNVGGDATTVTAQAPNRVEVDRLEGLSDHSYNIIGMYEKGPFAARLAYNWRSEYLTTAIDCCVAYAIWTEEQGFLDGSLRYAVNDNFELSLQGSNLLNTDTILYQQVTDASDGGLLLPNGYFQNDRRFTVGLRFKY